LQIALGWWILSNSAQIKPGTEFKTTYSTGYGSYTNYVGGTTFKYDSVSYFRNGSNLGSDYYEILSNDTLVFGAGIAGRFSSYSLPNNGSMWFIKQ
jgi:hypothetical protein